MDGLLAKATTCCLMSLQEHLSGIFFRDASSTLFTSLHCLSPLLIGVLTMNVLLSLMIFAVSVVFVLKRCRYRFTWSICTTTTIPSEKGLISRMAPITGWRYSDVSSDIQPGLMFSRSTCCASQDISIQKRSQDAFCPSLYHWAIQAWPSAGIEPATYGLPIIEFAVSVHEFINGETIDNFK